MQREAALLDDIVRSADAICSIRSHLPQQDLMADEVAQAAILHHLTVIGEAASRLPEEFRSRHTEIAWSRIVSQRNRIVHDYFGLDWVLLWKTVSESVPELRRQVARILAAEYPEDAADVP